MPQTHETDTAAMIAGLRRALASNVTEVTIGTQTVKYRSVSDLMAALRYYENLQQQEATGGIGRVARAIDGGRFL